MIWCQHHGEFHEAPCPQMRFRSPSTLREALEQAAAVVEPEGKLWCTWHGEYHAEPCPELAILCSTEPVECANAYDVENRSKIMVIADPPGGYLARFAEDHELAVIRGECNGKPLIAIAFELLRHRLSEAVNACPEEELTLP